MKGAGAGTSKLVPAPASGQWSVRRPLGASVSGQWTVTLMTEVKAQKA